MFVLSMRNQERFLYRLSHRGTLGRSGLGIALNMFKPVLVGILLFVLTGCSVDPVTGKSSFNFYSENQEIQMGNDYHKQIMAEMPEYKDPKLQQYVQKLVNDLGGVSHRPNLDYPVVILDSPEVNAFAIPGGHVYIFRGLLTYFNSEAELAGVMAHEIGHVTARHSVERLSTAKALDIGAMLGSLLLYGNDEEKAKQSYNVMSRLSVLGQLSYSRENEMEADRLAVDYTYRAGYSPLGVEQTMKMFERMSGSSNELLSILSTHPASDIRAKQARIEVRKKLEHADIVTNLQRDRYLDMISGLDLGERPTKDPQVVLPKLRIYTTQKGDTWESLTKQYFPKDDPKRLAWMNGCEVYETLPAKIKLALF